MEHRLGSEHAANRHAVEPTYEATLAPDFDAVRHARPVQFTVSALDIGCDPSGGGAVPRRGTVSHDQGESAIDFDFETRRPVGPRQSSRDVEISERHDSARIGRPPSQGAIGKRPREDAVRVSV
jgi:hypothetical protein